MNTQPLLCIRWLPLPGLACIVDLHVLGAAVFAGSFALLPSFASVTRAVPVTERSWYELGQSRTAMYGCAYEALRLVKRFWQRRR